MTWGDESFDGSARFELRRRIGHGGMGVVYQTHDRVRCVDVALKTLRNVSPNTIYRLKREFRALTDLSHPNLATLYELFQEDGRWFFTMELVDGVGFINYVRQASAFSDSLTTGELLEPTLSRAALTTTGEALDGDDDDDDETETLIDPPRPPSSIVNIRRLRASLRQLTEGLIALHTAGRLHRDIKPSNVLVDPDGRVVILDFGLVAELMPSAVKSATEQGRLIGTPAYMAPEQAGDDPLTPAADWYAVGCMLYEALTGRLPFPGEGLQQLLRKYSDTPLVPATIAPGTPRDLNDLTMRLLRRLPTERADGADILAIVKPGTRAPSVARLAPRLEPTTPKDFVGRERELATLSQAYLRAKQGSPSTVFVQGQSGMGKSALVRNFLDSLGARDDVLILKGRCYEAESVPYKALDSIVDALSHHLRQQERLEVEALLPRDVRALTKVFPVLERVDAIADAPTRRANVPDKHELKRRAFKALKELLARISDRVPLVIFIDDLQWGDIDSAPLIIDLMRPPEAPSLLLIGAFRSEEAESSALVRALLGARPDHMTQPVALDRPRIIHVEPLDSSESDMLVRRLVGPHVDRVDSIVGEAGGHPFLLESLARLARRARTEGDEPVTLELVIRERVADLPRNAARLLEIVAVAGRPISPRVALRAAGLDPAHEQPAMDALRTTNLVRTGPAAGGGSVETYHDRIRETVRADLSIEDVRQRHRSLALVLEMLEPDDAHALYLHYEAAGDPAAAAGYAVLAGEQAAEALAFDRAARMYFAALAVVPEHAVDDRRRLLVKLADALANAGLSTEAGHTYMRAAELADEREAMNHQWRAAEQFLTAGRVNEGFIALQDVLTKVQLQLADSPEDALANVVENRKRLADRGLEFESRDESEVDPEQLQRIDVLGSIATGLAMIDTVRGADFQLQHLLAALDAGEPKRIARALALEASYLAGSGGRGNERSAAVTRAAVGLSHRLKDPQAAGRCSLAAGVSAHLRGDWRRGRAQLERTEKLLTSHCAGMTWELATARIFLVGAMSYLGDLRAVAERVSVFIEDSDRRGDLYSGTIARAGNASLCWLLIDEPVEASRQLDEVMSQWPSDRFYLQHYMSARARSDIDLYQGDFASAKARIQAVWPGFRASRIADTQYMLIDGLWQRAKTSAAIGTDADLESAAADADALDAESMDWASALAKLARSSIALARGDRARTIEHSTAALEAFEAAGMLYHAASTRYRLGQVLGGVRGDNLTRGATTWFEGQGVKRPASFARILAPMPPQ